jgi:hypothetical protein
MGWFEDNAPGPQPKEGGWFAQNAPKATAEQPKPPGALATGLGLALAVPPKDVQAIGSTLGPDLWGMAKSLPQMAMGPLGQVYQGIKHAGEQYESYKATGKTPEMLENEQLKAQGYPADYRYVERPVMSGLGFNMPGMEGEMRRTDIGREEKTGKVLGHLLAPPAAAAATAGMAKGVPAAGRAVSRALPDLGRAGAGIEILKEHFGDVPTNPAAGYKLAGDLVAKLERQGVSVPNQLRTVAETIQGQEALGLPTTFKQLHEWREALNDLRFAKDMPGKTAAQAGQVAKLFGDELQRVADQNGFGKDWRAQQKEYARASAIQRTGREAGTIVGTAAGYHLGRMAGEPVGGVLIGGMVGREVLGKAGGRVIGRALHRKTAGPPQLTSVPPDVAAVAPEVPLEARAKGGPVKAGHPYIVGEHGPEVMVPRQAGNIKPLRRPPMPATAEEYTRILLKAKEGEIAPDEATRRIVKLGGSGKVRPLRRPPQ